MLIMIQFTFLKCSFTLSSMSCIDVPLSAPMYQFLERGSLALAYQTACLGVTESDWETLGKAALETLDLDVARKSFARLKDLRYLELITDLMDRKKAGTEDDQALLADVLAFQVRVLLSSIRITSKLNLFRASFSTRPSCTRSAGRSRKR